MLTHHALVRHRDKAHLGVNRSCAKTCTGANNHAPPPSFQLVKPTAHGALSVSACIRLATPGGLPTSHMFHHKVAPLHALHVSTQYSLTAAVGTTFLTSSCVFAAPLTSESERFEATRTYKASLITGLALFNSGSPVKGINQLLKASCPPGLCRTRY